MDKSFDKYVNETFDVIDQYKRREAIQVYLNNSTTTRTIKKVEKTAKEVDKIFNNKFKLMVASLAVLVVVNFPNLNNKTKVANDIQEKNTRIELSITDQIKETNMTILTLEEIDVLYGIGAVLEASEKRNISFTSYLIEQGYSYQSGAGEFDFNRAYTEWHENNNTFGKTRGSK